MVYPALLPLMPHNSAASSRLNWRPPTDLNGLANAVGSQYSSHYLGTWCNQHYYRWCAHLGCQQSTELTPPCRFKLTLSFRAKYKIWFLRVWLHISKLCLQPDWPHMTIPHMRIAYLIIKAVDTKSECVIIIPLPHRHWFRHHACVVAFYVHCQSFQLCLSHLIQRKKQRLFC